MEDGSNGLLCNHPNVAFCRFCLVQLDKYIYAIGGCNIEGNLSSVARYLDDNDEWDLVSPMPIALRFAFCVLYLFSKL